MKYYTSIEQSKKLLELGLNPNTADMFYPKIDEGLYSVFPVIGYEIFKKQISDIPCWSLGALLDVLPSATLDSSDDHYYRLQCMGRSSEWYDSAVGACVDMIEKLHKQNLLQFN